MNQKCLYSSFILHPSGWRPLDPPRENSMRWYILRTLLYKEVLRHLANRGGIALALLLVVAALLLSVFQGREGQASGFAPGVQVCFVDYWEEDALVAHLRQHRPADLREHLRF